MNKNILKIQEFIEFLNKLELEAFGEEHKEIRECCKKSRIELEKLIFVLD